MTHITIRLERGPDDQPAGRLKTTTGQVIQFTGWLNLIRVLEDQLRQAPRSPDANPANSAEPLTP